MYRYQACCLEVFRVILAVICPFKSSNHINQASPLSHPENYHKYPSEPTFVHHFTLTFQILFLLHDDLCIHTRTRSTFSVVVVFVYEIQQISSTYVFIE